MTPIARLAGSDTREASGVPAVRLAARAAFLVAGPLIAAIVAFGAAWRDALNVSFAMLPLLGALGALTAGVAVWKVRRPAKHLSPLGPSPLIAVSGFAAFIAWRGDAQFAALALPLLIVVSAALIGDLARLATLAAPRASASAASGIVLAAGVAGIMPAVHLLLVGTGAGLPRAAGWIAAEAFLAAVTFHRAQRSVASTGQSVASVPADPSEANALTLDGIDVSFGANHVLRGVSFSVQPGELVALVGGNGSGKSTLLRAAAGLVDAHDGRVYLGADDVTVLRTDERAAAGLAFVSGARPIFPDLSVEQNLRVAAYRTHRGQDLRDALDAILSLVPTLEPRRTAKAGVLSGGEQRLLAVAATLFSRPSVLLADELTLGLDAQARGRVLDLLRAFADEGFAVVVVDHDLASLLPRAHRALLLDDGHLIPYADPSQILSDRRDLLPAIFLAGVDG